MASSEFSDLSDNSDSRDLSIVNLTKENAREKLLAEIKELERLIGMEREKRFVLQAKISAARKPRLLSRVGGLNSSLSQNTSLSTLNAPLLEKLNIFTILSGIRISSYQDQPMRMIVQIIVNETGRCSNTYFVAFNCTHYDTFTLGACEVPFTGILDTAKEKFPLSTIKCLAAFLQYVQRCCMAFIDRRHQINEFKVLIKDQHYTVFNTFSIEYADIGLPLSRAARNANVKALNINLYYRQHHTLPYELDIKCSDVTLRKELELKFRVLYCFPLSQAFASLKQESESSSDSSDVDAPPILKKLTSYRFNSSGEDDTSDSDVSVSDRVKQKRRFVGPMRKRFKKGAGPRVSLSPVHETDSELSNSSEDEGGSDAQRNSDTPLSSRGKNTVTRKKLLTGMSKPTAGRNKSTLDKNQSMVGGIKSNVGKNKSTVSGNKSTVGKNKSIVDKNQSTVGGNTSTGGKNKPTVSGNSSRPVTRGNKSPTKSLAPVFLAARSAKSQRTDKK